MYSASILLDYYAEAWESSKKGAIKVVKIILYLEG